jgi:hypothetical protein
MGNAQGFKKWRGKFLVAVFSFIATNAYAEQAKMSDTFVDSIGVNTHMVDKSSPYYTNLPAVINAISSSGIRHLRDSFDWDMSISNNAFTLINQVKANTGTDIKFLITTALFCNVTSSSQINPGKYISYGWSAKNISGFEGFNEPEGWCTNWAADTRNAQQFLYNAVKSNPQISMIPVLGPGLYTAGGASQVKADSQAIGDISAYMDYGNVHNYTNGSMPIANDSWLPSSQDAMDGTKPTWATEMGYPQNYISTAIANKYYSRIYFDFFNNGIPRTYAYELMDESQKAGAEGMFGLVYGDGSPKPMFTTIKNIISILKDPGSSFVPGSLNYSLSSTDYHLHHTLLQKRNGRFYLALWLEYNSWDVFSPLNLTVNLGSTVSQVNKYDPLTSANANASYSNVSSVNVSVSDQVMILEIVPSSVSPSPTPTSSYSYAITVTSPASGATVSGTIQVKGTAPGMLNLEIFDSASNLLAQVAPDAAGNFSASVDTTKLADGAQTLRIDAWDAAAGQVYAHSDEKLLSLNIKNAVVVSPSYAITIISPSANSTVSGIIQVKGSAPGMLNVEIFSAANVLLARATPDAAGNFSASIDTNQLANGTQTFKVDAWDSAAGDPSFSHSDEKLLSLNIQNSVPAPASDTQAPSVAITSPGNGASFATRSTITVNANATDNVGIVDVKFYLNGTLMCTDSTAAYSCSMRLPKQRRTNTIEAVGRDAAGNVGRQSIVVYTK